MPSEIKTTLRVHDFDEVLKSNPGLILIKFGASFCKPCQVIKDSVHSYFSELPDTVVCYDIDIEEDDELFSMLRKKRLVSSIPTILAYQQQNTDIGPNDSVAGIHVHEFFNRCNSYIRHHM